MAKYKVRSHRVQVSRIEKRIRFENVERTIVRDKKFRLTMFSYAMIVLISVNMSVVHSPVLGIAAASVYFLINATFLGSTFSEKEDRLLRFVLGNLLLIVFLGLFSWIVMMVYNLDALRSTIVLCIVAALSSFLSKMAKYDISIGFSRNESNA